MSLLQQTVAKIAEPNAEAVAAVDGQLQYYFPKQAKALGELRHLLLKYVGITGETEPAIPKKCTIITCGDHGVAEMKVSAYPQETTTQMTRNYVASRGAVANAMSNFCQSDMMVVDMGIVNPVEDQPEIINARIAPGTKNFTKGPAMTREQAVAAIETGIALAEAKVKEGYRCFLPGEMGIANTSSSAAMVACLCGLTPEQATGRGTNISDSRLKVKIEVVRQGLAVNQPDPQDGIDVMAKLGGFELACITGIILGAAAHHCFVVLDGFNTGSAALVAQAICPKSRHYLMASHLAAEPAHEAILTKLGLHPYLDLNFRLGEATGSSIAVNILDCAIHLFNELKGADYGFNLKAHRPKFEAVTAYVHGGGRPEIPEPDEAIRLACRQRIDNLIKPIYSLGRLEELAELTASLVKEVRPTEVKKKILVITGSGGCGGVEHRLTQALAEHAGASYHFVKASVRDEELAVFSLEDVINEGYSYGRSIQNVDVLGLSFVGVDYIDPLGRILWQRKGGSHEQRPKLNVSLKRFLALSNNSLLRDFAFGIGVAMGAAGRGILVLSDNYLSQLALAYAEAMVPETAPYFLYVKPDYLDLDITVGGGAVCAIGMKLIDAALQMMKDMKTFAEAGVPIADDGPGAGIQVNK